MNLYSSPIPQMVADDYNGQQRIFKLAVGTPFQRHLIQLKQR